MSEFNLKTFKTLTRAYTLPMSIFPFLIGYLAYLIANTNHLFVFNPSKLFFDGVIALFGVIMVHLFANLFDDYIDVKKQLKMGIPFHQMNFKSKRKARAILNGTYSMDDVKQVLVYLAIFAGFSALYFICNFNPAIVLSYIIPAAILALLYPVSSKFGLSEIIIAIVFGPLLIHGIYHVFTGSADTFILILSIASGIMTSILALTQGIMDFEFDIVSGKKSFPVILKDKNSSIALIGCLIIISYMIIISSFFSSGMPIGKNLVFIPVLISVSIAVKLISSLFEYINIKDVPFIPKWYYGPMENWETIKAHNFCYYMFRFYLARNLAIVFNIGLIIALLIFSLIKTPFMYFSPILFF